MAEITVGGIDYRIGKMNARKQFHVMRKIAPLLSGLSGMISEMRLLIPPNPASTEDGAEGPAALQAEPPVDRIGAALKAFDGLTTALSSLPEADCDFVLDNCMMVIERLSGRGWAPVWSRAANRMAFEDIELPAMLELSVAALRENLGPFFSGLAQSMPAPAPASTSS